MIQKLFRKILQRTLHRFHAHAHLRRFRKIRSSSSLRSRWIPRLTSKVKSAACLFALGILTLPRIEAQTVSEVHVIEAQWMDVKFLLQTQIKALAQAEQTAMQTQMIAQTTKSMELMQKAQADIAFQMKIQIPALQLHGQLVQQSPNGKTKTIPANGLQFNPQTGQVEGGNFAFTDSLLSQRGVPISMDKIAPSWVVPVPPEQANALLQKSADFIKSAAKPLLRAATDSIIGNNSQAANFKSVINQAGDQVISGLLSEGVSIRPYEPGKDDAYAYYQNASAQEQMAYFSSPLYRDGSQIFNPILGSVSEQAAQSLPGSVDLANTFSAGAKAAIDQYLQSGATIPTVGTFNSSTSNPYSGFAADLYDQVIAAIRSGQIKPGDAITITPEMLQRASQNSASSAVPQSVKSFPPLFKDSSKLSVLSLFSPFLASIGSSAGGLLTSSTSKYVLAATGNPNEVQQLQSICSASDQRLVEIQKQIGYQSQMLTYTEQLLESLRTMRTQAQAVQQTLTPQNAIPQITQMAASIDESISARDREIANYQRTIQQLQGERFEELKSRAERVTQNRLEQQSTANHQLARAGK
ncbi:MAG: hypothetical protein V4507_03750 [Verrucomicrobiota bacterium]